MWRVGVDSGGTFTDICLVDDLTGAVRVRKVPSTPDDPSRAIAHGLIPHRGAPTDLITTDGFHDLLEIGRQRRPHLYDLQSCRPLLHS